MSFDESFTDGMVSALYHDGMVHKISTWPTAILLLAASVIAKLRAIIQAEMPIGYQDETGFHTGVKKTGSLARIFHTPLEPPTGCMVGRARLD